MAPQYAQTLSVDLPIASVFFPASSGPDLWHSLWESNSPGTPRTYCSCNLKLSASLRTQFSRSLSMWFFSLLCWAHKRKIQFLSKPNKTSTLFFPHLKTESVRRFLWKKFVKDFTFGSGCTVECKCACHFSALLSQLRILPIFLSEEGVTHRNVGDYSCHLFRHPFVSQIKIYPETWGCVVKSRWPNLTLSALHRSEFWHANIGGFIGLFSQSCWKSISPGVALSSTAPGNDGSDLLCRLLAVEDLDWYETSPHTHES